MIRSFPPSLRHRTGFVRVCVILFVLAGTSAQAQPPPVPGARRPDLVELVRIDTSFHLDIRYATANNFMKRPMYAQPRAFLQRPAAEALRRAAKELRTKGYGILIFDGYRPWSVTKKFWDETPPEKHSFVADPRIGSKHNRGCAIDCSLYSLRTGREVTMPSPYDDFTAMASPRYAGGTKAARRARGLLRGAMERQGFTVDGGEWWHFDYKEWRTYDVLDIPFEELILAP
jgi:D-alanyl-D-alanine dipeptidase